MISFTVFLAIKCMKSMSGRNNSMSQSCICICPSLQQTFSHVSSYC